VSALGSLVVLIALVVAAPAAMVAISRLRFDTSNPVLGIARRPGWSAFVEWVAEGRAGSGPRSGDELILDGLVLVALGTGWVSIVLLVVSIVLETVHRVRYGGNEGPGRRGPQWSRRLTRYVATGLIAVMPQVGMVRASEPALRDVVLPAVPAAQAVPFGSQTWVHSVSVEEWSTPRQSVLHEKWIMHRVVDGESVLSIAQRYAGERDPLGVAYLILEANLGREMVDGTIFRSPAVVEPNWQLQVPVGENHGPVDAPRIHRVTAGDTLWDIAASTLGDGRRWPEIWHANAGKTFADGRTFSDPDLILPGWELVIDDPRRPEPASVDDLVGQSDPVPLEPALIEADDVIGPDIADQVAPLAEATPPPLDSHSAAVPTPRPDGASQVGAEPTTASEAGTAGAIGAGDAADMRSAERGLAPLGIVIAGTGGAAMLLGGIIAAVQGRRRRALRATTARLHEAASAVGEAVAPGDRSGELERAVCLARACSSGSGAVAAGIGDPMVRLDLGLRAVAAQVASVGAGVVMVRLEVDGTMTIRLDRPVHPVAPWQGDQRWWRLDRSIDIDRLATLAAATPMPSLAMVQIGQDRDEAGIFVDLETARVLSVRSETPGRSTAAVAAIGVCLAGSDFADGVRLVVVGLNPAIVMGRPASTVHETVDAALADLAAPRREPLRASTFSLRARSSGGERWEPTIVLADAECSNGEPAGLSDPPAGVAMVVTAAHPRAGLTLVDHGESWLLGGELLGDHTCEVAVNLVSSDGVEAIDALVGAGEARAVQAHTAQAHTAQAHTVEMVGGGGGVPGDGDWRFMVRLLGPVDVVSHDATAVVFERSRSVELLAWMVTHRRHSTRLGARTAIWESDVRNSTFANIVSDARRTLARSAGDDDDWIARTLTDDLVLHERVCSDAEVIEACLAAARECSASEVVALLAPAVGLIRSMPFEATGYLWPDPEGITTTLIMLVISATTCLAEAYLELGDDAGVYRATDAGLAVIAGHEDLIALRLRALGRQGDHAGLRHEWEAYRRSLERDRWADGEPSWRLVELRDELLAGGRTEITDGR